MPEDQTTDNWYDPEATTFGDRLTGAREAAGLGQAELARRIGVKIKTLRAWENDQSEPRANRLSTLCGLLNVSLVWLLTGEAVGQTPTPVADEDGALLEEVESLRREALSLTERLGLLETRLRTRLAGSA
ncbi:helix-turn-helix domain-containing protein [Jannaschia seohaensis]|uniref:Helix-turn-helix domain-containing protein n=1 Tax=Jannaschia seohaensis TaxID=475081 RepID=A0A2Y9C9A7_9RHOB|nr:helix-turn-helix transcriptional regulator [Jannaschia seohaensis]PWJ09852.1 helix-turn-helix protein [Jannaschia seohaensis]SSA51933.1 Helix-turn-helix domain-containing protein [Jannaschia seohaensis]